MRLWNRLRVLVARKNNTAVSSENSARSAQVTETLRRMLRSLHAITAEAFPRLETALVLENSDDSTDELRRMYSEGRLLRQMLVLGIPLDMFDEGSDRREQLNDVVTALWDFEQLLGSLHLAATTHGVSPDQLLQRAKGSLSRANEALELALFEQEFGAQFALTT